MKKKKYLVALVFIIIVAGAYFLYVFSSWNKKAELLPVKYQKYAEICQDMECCMASVKTAASGGYEIIGQYSEVIKEEMSDKDWESLCPVGQESNMLKCGVDGFVWCEPIKEN